jgi:hypothetical protein
MDNPSYSLETMKLKNLYVFKKKVELVGQRPVRHIFRPLFLWIPHPKSFERLNKIFIEREKSYT